MPRFQGENLERNVALAEQVEHLAAKKGCTAAQLALAWVLAQGEDIVPIPGTKRRVYLDENVAAVALEFTAAELAEIAAALPPGAASGMRYPEWSMKAVNR